MRNLRGKKKKKKNVTHLGSCRDKVKAVFLKMCPLFAWVRIIWEWLLNPQIQVTFKLTEMWETYFSWKLKDMKEKWKYSVIYAMFKVHIKFCD